MDQGFSYQDLGACFRPYIGFLNLHTKVELGSTKLGGCCMYTSSWRYPLRKALLMSICCTYDLYVIAKERMILMVVGLTTCDNVSWKSKPCCWMNPLDTRIFLYLLALPYEFSLTLNTYLYPIGFLWGVGVYMVQVPSFRSDSYIQTSWLQTTQVEGVLIW